MKFIKGIAFPDGDTHFEEQLAKGPLYEGKGTYQFRKIEGALQHVPRIRRRHALDIGGHVGLWSRVLAREFARVTAFEPMPAHLECFRANLPPEEYPNVALVEHALGARAGSVRMTMPADNTGHTHVSTGDGFEVPIKPLDEIDPRSVDFIKIDVEGFEEMVLLGAMETIRRERPVIVVEQKKGNAERYGRDRFGAKHLLQSWGMRKAWNIGGDFCMVW